MKVISEETSLIWTLCMLHLSHMDMYVHSTIQALPNFFPKMRITPLIRTHSDQQCEQQNLHQ